MTDPQTPAGTRNRAEILSRAHRGERQGLSAMPTRRSHRSLIRLGAALALVLVLAACTAGGQFDPTEVSRQRHVQYQEDAFGPARTAVSHGVPGATHRRSAGSGEGLSAAAGGSGAADNGPEATAKAAAAAEKPKPKPKPKPRVAKVPAQQAHRSGLGSANGAAPPGAAGQRPAAIRLAVAAVRRSNQLAGAAVRRPILASSASRANELAGSAADPRKRNKLCAHVALDCIHAGASGLKSGCRRLTRRFSNAR